MKTNVGYADRTLRIIAAVVMAILIIGGSIASGVAVLIMAIVAGILILTGILGICPLYTAFGINTHNIVKAK